MIEANRPFTPDWVSPPGDTIADFLEERNWTQPRERRTLGLHSRTY
jgi:HTH-type transcriptional regulator/antitoxin HigA